jgi:steroid 5-alpha reductase family enzyme
VKYVISGYGRYSRHPNYFGELLITWGIFINAIQFGHIFIIVSPLLMTYFLFKFSGAGLMEETIINRKPMYKKYIQSTNSILPWLPKKS